ncbi:C40 family peptidase [Geodermatophilus sp. SYSU D00815]
MATSRPALGHAHDPSAPHRTTRTRPSAWLRSGLLLGATAALTVTLLPGTAAAEPGRATTPEQAAQLVAEASHQLEFVQEQVNTAREQLAQQEAAADAADRAAADAQEQLDALDGQIRQLARSAYTGGDQHLRALDVMLTSDSAEDFVSQLGTLEAIAGHTTEALDQVAEAADAAEQARDEADAAAAEAQQTLAGIEAQEAELESDIADYQAQYDRLTAAQQQQVVAAHGGESLAAPAPAAAVAPSAGGSAAAQTAVSTALAQVGDPYVWGAGGPNSFDCSGLTQYAYAAAGISLPHSSSMQSRMGTPVSRSALQPGDLIFFYSPVSHVAMYIGNGQMVHASTSGQPVKVVGVDSMPGYNSARRIA